MMNMAARHTTVNPAASERVRRCRWASCLISPDFGSKSSRLRGSAGASTLILPASSRSASVIRHVVSILPLHKLIVVGRVVYVYYVAGLAPRLDTLGCLRLLNTQRLFEVGTGPEVCPQRPPRR